MPKVVQSTVRKDIDNVVQEFSDFLTATPLPQQTSTEVKRILLTGATGFVGRVFLSRLMEEQPDITVHCLVRSENEEHGRQKIKSAMEEAWYWKDSYNEKIVIVPGDMQKEKFGLSDAQYTELSEKMDALYHFAASVNLNASYSVIRASNSLVMGNVLKFCATGKIKSLHHISTLAITHEYISRFPPHLYDEPVVSESPDVDMDKMELIVPPNMLGYPWSKWACEQIALKCSSLANIPLAIYRIPWMKSAADTGYTSKFQSYLVLGHMQENMVTEKTMHHTSSAVDVACHVILRLSLGKRNHIIYNVVGTDVAPVETYQEWMNEFGFSVKFVDDETFLAPAKNPDSPITKIASTLETLRIMWYAFDRPLDDPAYKYGLPISTTNTEEDYGKVEWPSHESIIAKSWMWIILQVATGKYSLPLVSLQSQEIIQHVEQHTGLSLVNRKSQEKKVDSADNATFLKALDILLDSANHKATLSNVERLFLRQDLTRRLINRARLLEAITQNPRILEQPIDKPIFIVGPDEKSLAHLHFLLSRGSSGKFRAPLVYEALWPVTPSTKTLYAGPTASDSIRSGPNSAGHNRSGPSSSGNGASGHSINGNATNGNDRNGHATNGNAANGHAINGHSTNGHAINGYATNGHATNGHAIDVAQLSTHEEIVAYINSSAADFRLKKAYLELEIHKIAKLLQGDPADVILPADDDLIFRHEMCSSSFAAIPSFQVWLDAHANMGATYKFHKIFLQYLQSHELNEFSPGKTNYRWLLRSVMHTKNLSHIFSTYPDATVIYLHPEATLEKYETDDLVSQFLVAHPDLQSRFIDIQYSSVIQQTAETIKDIYNKLG